MIKYTIGLMLAVFTTNALAIQYEGTGYGETREHSRKNALSSLSESLLVELKSEFRSEQHESGFSSSQHIVSTVSELPLLGVKFKDSYIGKEYSSIALLDSIRSLSLYRARLKTLQERVQKLNNPQTHLKRMARYQNLLELLSMNADFLKYTTVAQLLGGKKLPISSVELSSLRTELFAIESLAPSLDIVAEIITRDLPIKSYYVSPALPVNSNQATQLSRLLRDKIKSRIKTQENRAKAKYVLEGHYEITSEGIHLIYSAIDENGKTLATRVAKISESAYSKIEYKPASLNFQALLHEGYIVDSKFHAELNTSLGKKNLLFTQGQTIELFTKLNRAGYFYIVAHNSTNNISYLLELNEAEGKRAFVTFINADDINHWLSLGEFDVSPPYGTESLQLIASNKDLIDNLPSIQFDRASGLYIIQSTSMIDAVKKTRALKPRKKKLIQSTEATLTYTTLQ